MKTDELHSRDGAWDGWRGSKDVFAHVVSVGLSSIADRTAGPAKCRIDVEVGDDHEVFSSPREFREEVTLEGLRRFPNVSAEMTSGSLKALIELRWLRPWWKVGRGNDAKALLHVEGPTSPDVSVVYEKLYAALRRGQLSQSSPRSFIIGFVWGAVLNAIFSGTIAMIAYLLDFSETIVIVSLSASYLILLVPGSLWLSWACPSLEVAPYRQSNAWRLLKVGGPVVGSIMVTGVTKVLYG